MRIERHQRDRPGIFRNRLRNADLQRAITDGQFRIRVLHFDQQRRPPAHQSQNLGQRRDPLAAAGQFHRPESRRVVLGDPARPARQTLEKAVMEHHRRAAARPLDVDLDAVTLPDRRPHGGAAVLDHAARAIMQAAMGERRRQKRRVKFRRPQTRPRSRPRRQAAARPSRPPRARAAPCRRRPPRRDRTRR